MNFTFFYQQKDYSINFYKTNQIDLLIIFGK